MRRNVKIVLLLSCAWMSGFVYYYHATRDNKVSQRYYPLTTLPSTPSSTVTLEKQKNAMKNIEEEVLKVRYGVTVKNNKPVIGQAYDVKSTMKKPAEMDPRMKLASKLEIKNSSDILKFLFRPSEDESSSGYSSKSG
ncbi:hypothetical protein TSAR_009420 [Trichomalopsis sarcophagae]|uniref:Uncharacterized protein n=1 Tax=Trichomalopsis sarcophagae TaxID=543379 RepID=A0A232FL47_9HYME|nr:hypothetical protein TSAR_009420 [Trichomalopsis sarcophagae]